MLRVFKIFIIKNVWDRFQSFRFFWLRIFREKDYIKYEKDFLLVPNCSDGKNSLRHQYILGNLVLLHRPLNYYCEILWKLINDKIKEKVPYVIIRASDGEAYFLSGQLKGNGPIRHFTKSKSLSAVDLSIFKNGLLACDSRHVEMLKNNQSNFYNIYKKNVFSSIPFECIYALAASRRLFENNLKIGIIGSNKKIKIIQELMKFKQYQDYIGRSSFEDYIGVPEKGTANDPMALSKDIGPRLKNDIDIYLVGIGLSKMAVLPELKKYAKVLFLDIGAGISALAGLISNDRPYFGDWNNFRLNNYDYKDVDAMDIDLKKDRIIFLNN